MGPVVTSAAHADMDHRGPACFEHAPHRDSHSRRQIHITICRQIRGQELFLMETSAETSPVCFSNQ